MRTREFVEVTSDELRVLRADFVARRRRAGDLPEEANRAADVFVTGVLHSDVVFTQAPCRPPLPVAVLPPGWRTAAECLAEAAIVGGQRAERLRRRADWIRRVCAEAEAKFRVYDPNLDVRLGLDFNGRNGR